MQLVARVPLSLDWNENVSAALLSCMEIFRKTVNILELLGKSIPKTNKNSKNIQKMAADSQYQPL